MFSVKSVIKPGLQSLTETNRVITNYIDVLSLLCGISQITTLPYGQHASTTHPTINIVTSDLLANHLRGRYLDEKKNPESFRKRYSAALYNGHLSSPRARTRTLKIHRCHCLIYQGHRHGKTRCSRGMSRPPLRTAAQYVHIDAGTRRDSGDGAVCVMGRCTRLCVRIIPIRSRSIAFVPGLLSCTLRKKSARTRRPVRV